MPPKKSAKAANTNDDGIKAGRLKRLVISNFRSIGNPVTVDLDKIVVLVGPNNAGKSSILRAYEVVMLDGSKEGHLTVDDFPNGKINSESLPTIELHTVAATRPPASKWIAEEDGEPVVRERWVWSGIGAGDRQGWNNEL